MMRRIEAEERLASIRDGAAATGNLEPLEARRHQAQLQRAKLGGSRPKAAKATPAALAGMGIAVVNSPSAGAKEALSDG